MRTFWGVFFLCSASLSFAQSEFLDSTRSCNCQGEFLGNACKADIGKVGDWITISTDTKQCARVDWHSNSQPNVAIVSDGIYTTEWLGPDRDPGLSIQSCNICLDPDEQPSISSEQDASSVAAIPASEVSAQLVPIVAAAPKYPIRASNRGIQGDVTVSFDILPNGRPTNASVTCSSSEYFEEAAIESVLASRYKPVVVDGSARKVIGVERDVVFEFSESSHAADRHCSEGLSRRRLCATPMKVLQNPPIDKRSSELFADAEAETDCDRKQELYGNYLAHLRSSKEQFVDSEFLDSTQQCSCYGDRLGESCTSTIQQRGDWIQIQTPGYSGCARVDWYTDSDPQTSIVTGGVSTTEWLGQKDFPTLRVQSCRVCVAPEKPPEAVQVEPSVRNALPPRPEQSAPPMTKPQSDDCPRIVGEMELELKQRELANLQAYQHLRGKEFQCAIYPHYREQAEGYRAIVRRCPDFEGIHQAEANARTADEYADTVEQMCYQ